MFWDWLVEKTRRHALEVGATSAICFSNSNNYFSVATEIADSHHQIRNDVKFG